MKTLSCNRIPHYLRATILLCVFGAFLPLSARANGISFVVTANASSLSGTSGYYDLQFNPGAVPGTQIDNAEVVYTTGWLVGNNGAGGVCTGDCQEIGIGLPDLLLEFRNDTAFNDYFQPITFGSSPDSIVVNFDGSSFDSPDRTSISGSTFAISFFDSNMNPVLTNNPDGFAGIINLNVDGTVIPETFRNSNGGHSALTIINPNPPPPPPPTTPEPGSFLLLSTGLLAAVSLIRRKAARPDES